MQLSANSIGAALLAGEQRLRNAHIIRPRRHTELLLEAALDLDRTQLYLHTNERINMRQMEHFQSLLTRREAGEPVQYIVGWAPFYGRKFHIGKGVFIPRFETELLVERLLENIFMDKGAKQPVEILDLCCGSGVIGLTAIAEIANASVTLIDISEAAIEYCSLNAETLRINDRTTIINRDVLDEFPKSWQGKFHYVLLNPPYIPLADVDDLPIDVREGEPHKALTDFDDGLRFYRRGVQNIPQVMTTDGALLVECGDNAAGKVREILSEGFSNLITTKDLEGIERVVEGTRKYCTE
ncbi:MAG: peptide chain release factor N(5)-glutamine methyltransferase [Candidatus Hatepunaea meridiana]|nr:peptide chain release factor N(5)-glutamine methyltransferase [Candidatus Hatepunaea meridiana]